MKRNAIGVVLAVLLVTAGSLPSLSQTIGVPVEGKVTQEGKPLPNAQVVLTNVETGKIYKSKTDKNGQVAFLGVSYGNFRVDVLGEDGGKLFSEQTSISANTTTSMNVLSIDIPKGGAQPDNKFGIPDPAAPKLTKEQLAKIKADNQKIAGLNNLINDAQNARQAQDWPKAENALKQLIAAAPDSSRWDFYWALGDAQSHSNKFQDAVQTFDKGIQIAQSLASGATPPDPKNPNSSPSAAKAGAVRMLTSQANAYLKLEKPDEAIGSLKKAAEMEPASPVSQYNLCGVQFNAQKYNDAKITCSKFLELEPNGAHTEEVKGFLAQMRQK
jgi:hypothetical protein